MRKFLIALVVVAQPAAADLLLSMSPENQARLIMEQDLPLPKGAMLRDSNFWSIVSGKDANMRAYLNSANSATVMNIPTRSYTQCAEISNECIDNILFGPKRHD
jgi:hypothetical protein